MPDTPKISGVEVEITSRSIKLRFPLGGIEEFDVPFVVKALKCAVRINRYLKGHGLANVAPEILDEDL